MKLLLDFCKIADTFENMKQKMINNEKCKNAAIGKAVTETNSDGKVLAILI